MQQEPHPQRDNRSRRTFIEGALMGLGGTSLATLAAGEVSANENSTATRTGLYPGEAPSADSGYSPGIRADGGQRVIFVSGQGPQDRTADMETQIRQTFDRIQLVLKEGGATFDNVVILRSYFVHLLRDLPIYREVRKDYLVQPYPASTAVGVPELAFPDLELEIEAVAIV